MRDASKLRGEREIWITRGHLWALAVTTCCIGLLSFFIGLLMGRAEWIRPELPAGEVSLVSADLEADALDDLLARVEEAAAKEPPEEVLTFPGALPSGEVEDPPEEVIADPPLHTLVLPAREAPVPPVEEPQQGPVPKGGWAVQIGSFTTEEEVIARMEEAKAAGVDPYRISAVVDGVTRYRLRVGGFHTREEAATAIDDVARKASAPDAIVVRAP